MTEENVREKIEKYLKNHPDPHVRKFLDDSDAYLKKYEEEQNERKKEIEERKEVSVFEESEIRGRLTHPVNPEVDRDPDFPSLTMAQRKRIEAYLREGLSIRSTKKAIHVDNFDVSFGTLQAVKKKMKEEEVHQSSSSSSSSIS